MMEKRTKRRRIFACLLVMALLFGAAGGAYSVSAANQNLIHADMELYHEDFHPDGEEIWTYEDGVFESTTDSIAASMWLGLPTLTSSYIWSGDITVNSINYEVMPNLDGIKGTFFRIGYDWNTDNYIQVVLSSRWSIGVEQVGAQPVQDIHQYRVSTLAGKAEYPAMTNGTTFHFEIRRDKNLLSMKIDDTVILDMDLSNCDKPGDYNLFADPTKYEFNLGVYSFYSSYKISNMSVVNMYPEEVTSTPAPTESASPTATEETVVPSRTPTDELSSTQAPAPTKSPATSSLAPDGGEDGDKGSNNTVLYILIGAGVVLIAGVAATIIVIKKRKK